MSFEVAADAYDSFMGRWSRLLAPELADLAGVEPGQAVLDVGAGTGALTAELVARLGGNAVTAVDPSQTFTSAMRERHPEVGLHRAPAEDLPFEDDRFDAALAQLVVHFMADAVAGLREMGRVTKPGGAIAASVWDHSSEQTPLAAFWRAVRTLDPSAQDESRLAGTREGHLAELFAAAGLRDVEDTALIVESRYATFDEWWEPFTFGVGPAGVYVQRLDDDARAELRGRCQDLMPDPPFTLTGRAWAARGRA